MNATGMDAPPAENIDGVLEERHTVRHEMSHTIDWGHIAIGLAVIVLVWAVFIREPSSDDDEKIVGGSR